MEVKESQDVCLDGCELRRSTTFANVGHAKISEDEQMVVKNSVWGRIGHMEGHSVVGTAR